LRVTRTALLVLILINPLIGADDATPQDQIESLASALTKGDASGALSVFDPAMPSFAEIKKDIQAISALPNTTCTIAVNRTSREGDSIRFETDWSLETYSAQNGPLLQRRDHATISLHHAGNSWLITALSPLSVLSPPDDSVFKRIAGLAADLNEKNQFGAIGVFSSQMKAYGEIDNDIDALVTQNDLLCAIDIVSDRQTGDVHTLDLDWYMQLKARTDSGPLTQRRERVKATMVKVKNKWEIIDIEPLKVLSPEVNQ
jgi:hypothetical protein